MLIFPQKMLCRQGLAKFVLQKIHLIMFRLISFN